MVALSANYSQDPFYVDSGDVNNASSNVSNVKAGLMRSCGDLSTMYISSDFATSEIPFTFIDGGIANISEMAKNSRFDVIGVIHDCGDLGKVVIKASGRKTKRRNLTIVDQTGYAIQITLWGSDAENFIINNDNPNPIAAFRGARIGDYHGRTLSLPSSGIMVIDPDIIEAYRLRFWYDNEGSLNVFSRFSDCMHIEDVVNGNLGSVNKPEYFSIVADSVYVKADRLYYPSCYNCKKKLIRDVTFWNCENCQKVYDKPNWCYILSLNVCDESGRFWIQGFNEVGQVIFGLPANEFKELAENNEEKYNSLLKKPAFNRYIIRCRAKKQTFNNIAKICYTAQSITEIK